MANLAFHVDAFDPTTGDKLGNGPLASVTRWEYTARVDRAGSVSFEMAASDPQAEHITNRYQAHGYALLDGVRINVGKGIIDKKEVVPGADGRAAIRVSGLDILGRANYRTMRNFEIGADSGSSLADALVAIQSGFVTGLSFVVVGSVPNDYFYAKFDGESALGALIYLAEKTETHFYYDPESLIGNVVFTAAFTDSGIVAVRARGQLGPNQCAITSLTQTIDSNEYLNRMYVRASGTDRETALTLAATTRTAGAGFTLNKVDSYIQNDTAIAANGGEIVDFPEVQFPEISPIDNTDADYVAASNMLFDVARRELIRRSTIAQQRTYTLAVAGCDARLRPMQTIRVVYLDSEQGINIDEDLYILEATWSMDSSGIRTTGLVVSTEEYWPKSANDNGAQRAVSTKVFQTHPQISLNEWQSNKTMLVGHDAVLGDIVGEFAFMFGPGTVMVKEALFRFKLGQFLSAGYRYTLDAATLQNDAISTGNSSIVNSADANPAVTDDFVGDVDAYTGATSTTDDSGASIVTGSNATGTMMTAPQDPTQVSTSNESFAGDPHFHNHGHTHPNTELAQHTHPAGHNHDVTHVHDMTHAHDFSHVHNVEHNHNSPQHTHLLTDVLNEGYGLSQIPALSTYAIADLEYAINGGGFLPLDVDAISMSGGFWEVDITEKVTHPTIPFRPAQSSGNNLVEIRRKGAAATGKNVSIDAIVYTRTVIQSVRIAP